MKKFFSKSAEKLSELSESLTIKDICMFFRWLFAVVLVAAEIILVAIFSLIFCPLAYFWPRRVASLVVAPTAASTPWWVIASHTIDFLWGWFFQRLSMKKRRFFIERKIEVQGFDLKNLSEEDQILYFLVSKDQRRRVFLLLSQGAQLAICKRKQGRYLKEVSSYEFKFNENFLPCFLLPEGDIEEKHNLLNRMAKDDKLTESAIDFIIILLFGQDAPSLWGKLANQLSITEDAEAAEAKMKDVFLPVLRQVLKYLHLTTNSIQILCKNLYVREAYEALSKWQKKNTLPSRVVDQLIEQATSNFADELKDKSFELLLQVLKKDWATNEQINYLATRTNSSQDEKVEEIFLTRWGKKALAAGDFTDFLLECKARYVEVPTEVQVLMNEEKAKIFWAKGFHLSQEVLRSFLLNAKEKEADFFKTLLEKEGTEGIEPQVLKALQLVDWKAKTLRSFSEEF